MHLDIGLKKIEVIANVSVIIVSVILGLVLVRNYLGPKRLQVTTSEPVARADSSTTPPKRERLQPGTAIDVAGIQWQGSEQTLLLALSTTCHFCSESAPFYQRLARERSKGTRIVAILPQSSKDSLAYLRKLAVNVDQVIQAPLMSMGVTGTPTMILIDRNGSIVDSWTGKLPTSEESKVISRIGLRE